MGYMIGDHIRVDAMLRFSYETILQGCQCQTILSSFVTLLGKNILILP